MRYTCYFCGKSVTSELPEDAAIRAILVCPECIAAKRIIIPERDLTGED
jgi:DNA-directed RNA polymerase subunit RPC12/RpoP